MQSTKQRSKLIHGVKSDNVLHLAACIAPTDPCSNYIRNSVVCFWQISKVPIAYLILNMACWWYFSCHRLMRHARMRAWIISILCFDSVFLPIPLLNKYMKKENKFHKYGQKYIQMFKFVWCLVNAHFLSQKKRKTAERELIERKKNIYIGYVCLCFRKRETNAMWNIRQASTTNSLYAHILRLTIKVKQACMYEYATKSEYRNLQMIDYKVRPIGSTSMASWAYWKDMDECVRVHIYIHI